MVSYEKPNQTKGGVPMSFEAISNIAQAEAQAKTTVANAEVRAKQLAADAESAGKLAVDSAVEKADAELKELSRQVNEKAKTQAEKLSGELDNQKAALRAKAEGKLEAAAAIVVERIVNS
jgi:hypothetical protein